MPDYIIPRWDEKAPLLETHTEDNRPCVSIPGGVIVGDPQSIMKLAPLATSLEDFKKRCEAEGFTFEPNEDI